MMDSDFKAVAVNGKILNNPSVHTVLNVQLAVLKMHGFPGIFYVAKFFKM